MIRKAETTAQTPMMQQYFSAKEAYPNEVLFFRMGDFYEMFFDDAETCAEVLGIALTARGKDREGASIPMAGIPVKAVDNYLVKLLKAGKRVAICEQVQDPKEAKGIVEREVVRVITPGTITDESVIGEKSNNYIAGLVRTKKGFGLSWLDITTGQFLIWETESAADFSAELARLSPAEVLLPESIAFHLDSEREIAAAIQGTFQTPFPDPLFDQRSAHKTLTEHFETKTLEGFGCEHLQLGIRAGGALLRYLQDTQKVALKHITRIQRFQESRIVPIDRATKNALELTETTRGGDRKGTLLNSFDRTATAIGGRLLREWLLAPLNDVSEIVSRQGAVAEFVDNATLRENVVQLLKHVHDVERISTRICYGNANARDLLSLGRTLSVVPEIRAFLEASDSPALGEIASRLKDHPDLREWIVTSIVDEPPLTIKEGGVFREGLNEELDELRQISTEGKQWFARFQQKEIERTGISTLKIGYNKVFGYYLEVTNAHSEKVPDDYIRKQTLKNAERYITPDLKEYENKVLHAKDRAADIEYELFVELREPAADQIPAFQETAAALAEADVLSCFASIAESRGYTRPVVNNSMRLVVEDGRHPVVEDVASTEPFIPNSIDLDDERHIMMITGPNMAGKSTYIRQVALLALLAQTGSFIPAKSAEIGVIDRLFTRVGASDDLTRGQSTFMVEMHETANILNNASERSLVILDEVGRGTSTFDGVSLAWAITEHIAEKTRSRTLFATHYHELTALAMSYPSVANFNFAVKEWNDEIIFLRKVVEGGADKSYGIHVARLAGIPKAVIDRAKEILSNLESQSLDIDDRPAIARRRDAPKAKTLQLDLFTNANDSLLRELKEMRVDEMTPLDALQFLSELKNRIV
ncbi:MAG: DNA mismatch repair protein MutS [Planctomycetota bacterium]